MSETVPRSVVVVGAGIAGATCARAMTMAGAAVHIVDKSRGAGGRLATKRMEWRDPTGGQRVAAFDHGAPAFSASDPDFRQFLATALPAGGWAQWRPTLATGSRPLDASGPLWLPNPDMPSLCRSLLQGIPTTFAFPVDRLLRHPQGWQVEAAGATLPGYFDAVVLAMPPAQAAPLLSAHRRDWAQRASASLMQPCWTLLGVTRAPAHDKIWDVGRPQEGLLDWVIRSNARPGRAAPVDEAHWIVHARGDWTQQHLEQPAAWVQARMQAALQDWLGEPLEWQHAVVHRWRYAMPQAMAAAPLRECWWDADQGLGVCGDFLGGTGVEGAWQSAQALSDSIVRGVATAPASLASQSNDRPAQRAAARVER